MSMSVRIKLTGVLSEREIIFVYTKIRKWKLSLVGRDEVKRIVLDLYEKNKDLFHDGMRLLQHIWWAKWRRQCRVYRANHLMNSEFQKENMELYKEVYYRLGVTLPRRYPLT